MEALFKNTPASYIQINDKFTVNAATNTKEMFSGCHNLETIYIKAMTSWNTSLITESTNMFYNCTKLPNYSSSMVNKTGAKLVSNGGYLTVGSH
jgi:hypothetical protein